MSKMEITRNVVLDLLPLYLAGEASADTVSLVENYLETDQEIAKMVKQIDQKVFSEVPVPLSKDAAMEAYIKANQQMIYRTLIMGSMIVVVILGMIVLAMAVYYGGFK